MTRVLKLLTVLAFALLWNRGVAQSSFRFDSPYPDGIVLDANGVPLFGPEYVAALYGGVSINSLQLARDTYAFPSYGRPMGFVPFDSFAPGYFNGPNVVVVSGGCGAPAWLQVRAWDTRVAPTYEAAVDLNVGGYGESIIFFAERGGNACLVNPDFPPGLSGMESFSLRPVVPEPSTWALLTVGGISVWWTRWRRKRT
jgi:hypothetical protein